MTGEGTLPPDSPIPRPADRRQFNQAVFAIVRCIPRGRVMTYGGVARWIPCPRSLDAMAYQRIRARWVGYALANCPKDVPWQRVLNHLGRASRRRTGGHEIQGALLADEGTLRRGDGTFDLDGAQWDPKEEQLAACAEVLRQRWGEAA